MKLSIPSIALFSLIGQANAFSNTPAFVNTQIKASAQTSSSLFASRNAVKIASRSAWAESRGIAADPEEESTSSLLTNENGLEYVKLENEDSSADIYLYGGVVTSYIKEGVEYIAVRPDAKTDGSKPISGGLSHCWPQVCLSLYDETYCIFT